MFGKSTHRRPFNSPGRVLGMAGLEAPSAPGTGIPTPPTLKPPSKEYLERMQREPSKDYLMGQSNSGAASPVRIRSAGSSLTKEEAAKLRSSGLLASVPAFWRRPMRWAWVSEAAHRKLSVATRHSSRNLPCQTPRHFLPHHRPRTARPSAPRLLPSTGSSSSARWWPSMKAALATALMRQRANMARPAEGTRSRTPGPCSTEEAACSLK